MKLTGTVSDLDEGGLFGLIIADDGRLLVFNLRKTPPVQRHLFQVGTRVEFTKEVCEPGARAVELVSLHPPDDSNTGEHDCV